MDHSDNQPPFDMRDMLSSLPILHAINLATNDRNNANQQSATNTSKVHQISHERQTSFSSQATRFSIPSVMNFLHQELRRYRDERVQWDLECAVLHKRVKILQGELNAIVKAHLYCMRIIVPLRTLRSAILSTTLRRSKRSCASAGGSRTRNKRIATRRNTSQARCQVRFRSYCFLLC